MRACICGVVRTYEFCAHANPVFNALDRTSPPSSADGPCTLVFLSTYTIVAGWLRLLENIK